MNFGSELFVTKISLNRKEVPSFNEYPFNIEIIKNLDTLELTSPVTFFVG